MALTPLADGGQRVENAGASTAVSRGTTITAAATANTKGSYTQLVASTAFDASYILVMIDDHAAAVDYLIDIAIGAGGSEQVILSNLIATGGTGSLSYGMTYLFPINIPEGSRVTARCQASTLSSAVRISVLLFGAGIANPETQTIVTTYGDNTVDSGGVSVDSGGVANTKGSYSQIVATTTYAVSSIIVAIGNQRNGVRSSQSWLMDIAIGAGGSEQVIVPNLVFNASTSPDIVTPQYYYLPLTIPEGSRIAVRTQSDGIDATDRLMDVIIYGVT